MAVERMKKAEIYIHKSVLDSVLAALQKTGSFEVHEPAEEEQQVQEQHPDLPKLELLLGESRFLLRFLEPYFKEEKSAVVRLLEGKDEVTLSAGRKLADSVDLPALAERMRDLERGLAEIRAGIAQAGILENLFSSLESFPYPLELITSGTEQVRGVLGSVPASNLDPWKNSMETLLGPLGEIFVGEKGEKKNPEVRVAVFYEKSLAASVAEKNAEFSFTKVDLPATLRGTVAEEMRRLSEEKEALVQQERDTISRVEAEAEKWVPSLRILSDYWTVLKDRHQTVSSAQATEQVIMLKGWIPERKVPEVQEEIRAYDSSVEFILSDPGEGDEPPILLKNSSWSKPFEFITKLFGLPNYGGIDPTPLMAPYFIVFFGMCLGDAGFGIVMIAVSLWLLGKYRKMPSILADFLKVFVLTGISTTVVGALTGSWFGNLIDTFPILSFLLPVKDFLKVIDPMSQPMEYLGISLALGAVHLFFGMGISTYEAYKNGDYVTVYVDKISWIVFLLSILLWGIAQSGSFPAGAEKLFKILTIVSALFLLVTQGREKKGVFRKLFSGALALYGTSSYLGDLLSYSRLLALGLASAAVGLIVNVLADLAGGVPFVGLLFTLILLVGGNIFSFVINVMGAFIHAMRLQFVEFFGKFYEGGGRGFEPLTYKTKYVLMKNESE